LASAVIFRGNLSDKIGKQARQGQVNALKAPFQLLISLLAWQRLVEGESRMNSLYLNNINTIASIAFAFLVVSLGGCATSSTAIPVETVVPAHDYLIGPGDTVSINVWRNPEVSQSVPVRPDGKITTPLVEDLPASGKTATELARDIEKILGKYIQQPVVTVIVTGFVGPYSEQIRVVGQAAKPQALPYRQGMSLMDVLIAVGGLGDFAAGNRANIVRTIDGKQQKIEVRLNDLIKKGDISANMQMRPGDVLIIPESFF
jgi:polysaccharide export outer membrane protein